MTHDGLKKFKFRYIVTWKYIKITLYNESEIYPIPTLPTLFFRSSHFHIN